MRVWKTLLYLTAFAAAAPSADLLIRNVTVIDVVTGAELPRQSILIHNGEIKSMGHQVVAPKAARLINGVGKFAIPGLWDMDVHLWYREHQFPLYLENGVTGVRDMGSDLSWLNQWRDQIKTGKLIGPRIQTCGPAVDGEASTDPKMPVLVVHRPDEARATFDRLEDLDADFVKVLPHLPRDAYFALIERARKYYKPVAGYLPDAVTMLEAIDARQKSVEHMSGLLLACSKQEHRLRSRLILAAEKHDAQAYLELQGQVLDSFDPVKADSLFRRMSQFDMRAVPGLTQLRRETFAEADQWAADPRLRHVSPNIRKGWLDPLEYRKRFSDEALTLALAQEEKLRKLIPAMRRAGVMIMAGSGTGDPYTVPGLELHRELRMLVEAGLSPLEALRSATIEPARFLGLEESAGSVSPGKVADLVLLEADPLKDIGNTRKIAAVIMDGRYLPRKVQ